MATQPTYRIVVTSNEPWGEVWFSKQHIAYALAQLGHEVYFLNAPQGWSPKHWWAPRWEVRPVEERLWVVDYDNPYPLRGHKRLMLWLNDRWVGQQLKTLLGDDRPVLWWQFDPFRLVDLPQMASAKRLYHVVDPYDHIWTDALLAERADLIVLVSRLYEAHYAPFGKPMWYSPHGISRSEQQLRAERLTPIEAQLGRDYMLFVGTLNPDVDVALLLQLAERLPERNLVLVGPNKLAADQQTDFEALVALPQVHYLGTQHALDLKEYSALAAVGLVPYRQSKRENQHRTPLKLLNYLAQATPIVTTLNYELTELNDRMIFVVEDAADFVQQTTALLDGHLVPDFKAAQDYIQTVRYDHLLQQILEHV